MELPECPVCLQSYDGEYTIPRVLACGHSVCEVCLKQLLQPFPHTIRCPACTQLVKYPHPQGPSALPKNIDLLRFSLPQNPNPNKSQKSHNQTSKSHQFIPRLWSDEFYSTWKDWVLPNDAVLVEPRSEEEEGLCSVLHGRIASSLSESMIQCCIKENQNVSLVRVTCSSFVNDSVFNFSYIVRVMEALSRMKDEKRAELLLILRVCARRRRICKACGLWCNLNDGYLYLVCERHNGSVFNKLGQFRNGIIGGEEDDLLNSAYFAMMGMEICESVFDLHSEGLCVGCLGLSCFSFDDFGRVYIDLSEILMTGQNVRRSVAEVVYGERKIDDSEMKVIYSNILKHEAFMSPEILFELFQDGGNVAERGSLRYAVECSSDVWSLACMLIRLLIGNSFAEEMDYYIHNFLPPKSEENGFDNLGLYKDWKEKVGSLLETKLGTKFVSLRQILCKCLNFDLGSRPLVTDVWKCIRELIIEAQFDILVSLEGAVNEKNKYCCLVLGELCQLPKEIDKGSQMLKIDDSGGEIVDRVGEMRIDKDVVEGVSVGNVKCISMQGHLDCISGLAVGGGFLFSSSFDKTINVWSLQDFSLVHSFRGHENRIVAVVFVDEEQPLCISGDSGGGIFIWSISIPFGQEPLKKWYEQKDWRYSGIHALTISGNGYLYTGSGDKSIKAWSLQDCTLSCTMNGHRSAVSSLAVCDGVLYSGSWDGTIRLWSLNDHSPLTVLGEDTTGNVISILSLSADRHMLVAAHENGCIKIWKNDVFKRSIEAHSSAVVALGLEGKWLFSGGWDKTVNVQELSGDEFQMDARLVGSIACDSVITALLYCQGKLFVGCADRVIKVYYYGQ